MAKKKKKQNKQPTKKNTHKPIPKQAQQQTRDPREASPKEILFFKIGMSVIGLAIIVIAIIFIVQYYMNKEATDPYEDTYITITVDELLLLTQYDEDLGVYGDPDTLREDDYEDINGIYQDNDYFYVYFYHSSDPNEEISAAVEANTGSDAIPTLALLEDEPDDSYRAIYFFDLDDTDNASLFTNTDFDHLGLDEEAENMLLTFSHNDNEFTLTIDINDILATISDLQS